MSRNARPLGRLGGLDVRVNHVQLACGEGSVHSEIFNSAANLAESHGTVKSTIMRALEENPGYGLVITGHSLGGDVAACLALLWSCPATGQDDSSCDPLVETPFVLSADSGLVQHVLLLSMISRGQCHDWQNPANNALELL